MRKFNNLRGCMARLAVVATLLSAPAVSGAYDFKGLALGEQITPKELKDRLGIRCGKGSNGVQVCNGVTTVAGFSTTANIVIGADGKLRRVMLSPRPDAFEDIARELVGKFGEPESHETSTAQNGFGAQYQQVEYVWKDGAGSQIQFRKYAGNVRSSMLYFGTAEDQQILSAPRAAKGDL